MGTHFKARLIARSIRKQFLELKASHDRGQNQSFSLSTITPKNALEDSQNGRNSRHTNLNRELNNKHFSRPICFKQREVIVLTSMHESTITHSDVSIQLATTGSSMHLCRTDTVSHLLARRTPGNTLRIHCGTPKVSSDSILGGENR